MASLVIGAGCTVTPASSAPPFPVPPELRITGRKLTEPLLLQQAAERAITQIITLNKMARAGDGSVRCWFAKLTKRGHQVEVQDRLWCGAMQVPGTGPAADWLPVPLRQLGQTEEGLRFEIQAPQLPEAGHSSVPEHELIRSDGSTTDPKSGDEVRAGPGFFAVMGDEGKQSNAELGLGDGSAIHVRDDLLAVRGTGWGTPDRFPRPDGGVLRPERGLKLAVLRLHSDRLGQLGPDLEQATWESGSGPPVSALSLDLPGGWQDVPATQLPQFGSLFLVFTLADQQQPGTAPARLVLKTTGRQGLEQQVELPSGRLAHEVPAVLRRPGAAPGPMTPISQNFTFKSTGKYTWQNKQGSSALAVIGARLGLQRPVKKLAGELHMVTAPIGKALVELQLAPVGTELPDALTGPQIAEYLTVRLPGGEKAKIAGIRFDGGVFPTAIVAEVPADVRSVQLTLGPGRVRAFGQGSLEFTPASGTHIEVPLGF